MTENIPDLNLFMMCESINPNALTSMPTEYHIRSCKKTEFPIWAAFPFDSSDQAQENYPFMEDFFNKVYQKEGNLFYENFKFKLVTW